MDEDEAETVFIKPKNIAAANTFHGFHCPKIKTAKAKNPYPATEALKFVEVGITKPADVPRKRGVSIQSEYETKLSMRRLRSEDRHRW